ncbi:MAG TPA: GntR family transcriptional regulator [Paracoccus sp. (in: a-proteobacteria)]|uniref:GntR family transcriptional regulator n=1 Tax=Paracoccus sp. TaxID=267 RepID=UPI002CF70604|nr:GntR family transcriptional regulator [Paracoccus sp. (in: a-proteobacteria)]HWL55934.1 GntR family transcriptional regulator [Paracoccus sp. (in: a-proteobacteria)]
MAQSKRSADQVHAALSERIVRGIMRPGDTLAESTIAAEFGMSRTPVREALHRLASEGLVERGPRRAFAVRRMGVADLRALFESLGEIEAICARLAAHRMTEIERDGLTRILAGDADDYATVNARFHDALREGAQNPVIAGLLDDLNRRSLPWRDASFRAQSSRIDQSRAEHRAILDAVLARDGDRAAALMRAHMASSLSAISEMLLEANA